MLKLNINRSSVINKLYTIQIQHLLKLNKMFIGTFVKVKLKEKNPNPREIHNSNTTFVKVKFGLKKWRKSRTKIQIQHLLKLNILL